MSGTTLKAKNEFKLLLEKYFHRKLCEKKFCFEINPLKNVSDRVFTEYLISFYLLESLMNCFLQILKR